MDAGIYVKRDEKGKKQIPIGRVRRGNQNTRVAITEMPLAFPTKTGQ